MDLENYSNIIRTMIRHENELRNSRINWLILTQGILLSGFIKFKEQYAINLGIAIVGIIIAISFAFPLIQSVSRLLKNPV